MLHKNMIEKSRFRTLDSAELEAVSGGDAPRGGIPGVTWDESTQYVSDGFDDLLPQYAAAATWGGDGGGEIVVTAERGGGSALSFSNGSSTDWDSGQSFAGDEIYDPNSDLHYLLESMGMLDYGLINYNADEIDGQDFKIIPLDNNVDEDKSESRFETVVGFFLTPFQTEGVMAIRELLIEAVSLENKEAFRELLGALPGVIVDYLWGEALEAASSGENPTEALRSMFGMPDTGDPFKDETPD